MYNVRAICQATSHTSFLHASSDSNSVPDQQLPMDVAPFVLLVSMHCVRAPIHPTMTQERRMSSRPLASVCLCIACWFVLAACFYHPGIGPGSAKQCIHEHLFLDPINQEEKVFTYCSRLQHCTDQHNSNNHFMPIACRS